MKKLSIIYFIFSAIILLVGCNTNLVLKDSTENKRSKNIYFSDEVIDYYSHAVEYSVLTRNKDIVDVKNKIDKATFERIRSLDIYPDNTMNFINPYNDTVSVVFSFPKRSCLKDNISDYLWNFSFSMQYIIIDTQKSTLVDSIKISHETRIVPPIDCAEKNRNLLHESIHSGG